MRNLRAGKGAASIRFHGNEAEVLSNTTGYEVVHAPRRGRSRRHSRFALGDAEPPTPSRPRRI